MKIAYFDCFAGASGDMILGAMLSAGLPLEYLTSEIGKLELDGYELGAKIVVKKGISGTQALIDINQDLHHHPHRHLAKIESMINDSQLKDAVKSKSIEIFQRLGHAEAKVHNSTIEKIHFHEVGAVDSIIDIVGAVIGIDYLKIERIYSSPINVGSGTVKCAHGILPVPAPATTELLKDIPIYSNGVEAELLTPTGAVLLSTFVDEFGPRPGMKIQAIGYGSGQKDLEIPNLLRITIGESLEEAIHHHHHN